MTALTTALQTAVRDLLDSEKVDIVVGFESGSTALKMRPLFLEGAGDVERLTWNSLCTNNLAVYLPRLAEKPDSKKKEETVPLRIGIVAKGCDARSAHGLVQENQISPEQLTVIAVPCTGMVDTAKIEAAIRPERPASFSEDGNEITVTTHRGRTVKLKKTDLLPEACVECPSPKAVNATVSVDGPSRQPSDARFARLTEMAARSSEERWNYFSGELSRCIRCYACRQACPNCFCKECFAEKRKPAWIGAGDEASDVLLYHLIRAYHQAGRCVQCDACVRACPMGIDLGMLNRQLGHAVEEIFGYTPGASETASPLRTFAMSDDQSFMTMP